MTERSGEIKETSPYQLLERTGYIRLEGEQGILELVVYFNDEQKVRGIFESGTALAFDKK